MYKNKLVVVACLEMDKVACYDEDVVAYLYGGVVACLDNNNKDDFDVDFILARPLELLH